MSEWISVNKLPENDNTVALLFEEDGGYFAHGIGHYSCYEDDIKITYNPYKNTVLDYKLIGWSPLPPKPEGKT